MPDLNSQTLAGVGAQDRADGGVEYISASAELRSCQRNIVCTPGDADIVVTMPEMCRCAGAIFMIEMLTVGTGSVTVNAAEGGAALGVMAVAAESLVLMTNGYKWFELYEDIA